MEAVLSSWKVAGFAGLAIIANAVLHESVGLLVGGVFFVSSATYKALVIPMPKSTLPGWVYRVWLLFQAALMLIGCILIGLEMISGLDEAQQPGIFYILGFAVIPIVGWMAVAGFVTALVSAKASENLLWYFHRTPTREEIELW